MEKRRLAIFDFDNTMIKGDSIADFVRFMWENKLISLPRLGLILLSTLMWMLRLLPVTKAKNQALAPLRKLKQEDVSALCREFVAQCLVPRVFPPALRKMQEHHLAGDAVLLVSASPAIYLSHIREFLPADAVLATPTDGDCRVIVNVRGEEKPRQVKRWLEAQGIIPDWETSWAYGDSLNDLPVMRLTGNPCWVNPGKAALKAAPYLPRLNWSGE
ncbi:MAG: HAD-IB family hydrolase [Eubacteriales bacterium]|nr:HAD-IB family hydrolase [Eubacteriales bacterium]